MQTYNPVDAAFADIYVVEKIATLLTTTPRFLPATKKSRGEWVRPSAQSPTAMHATAYTTRSASAIAPRSLSI